MTTNQNLSWTLQLTVTPAITVNNKIEPITHELRKLLGPADDIRFEVDLISMEEPGLLKQQQKTFQFDQEQPQTVEFINEEVQLPDYSLKEIDYFLNLVFKGKTDEHTVKFGSKSVTWVLLLDVKIEGLPIDQVLVENGGNNQCTTILGQNNIQSLQITTPIYRWLLDRYELIKRSYTYSLYS